MTEQRVGFLFKAASIVLSEQTKAQKILHSYYLLRCKEITKGYGLPRKQFSYKARCPRCFIQWKDNSEYKVYSSKLSKKQKQRIKARNKKLNHLKKKEINGKKIQRTCSFCNHISTTFISSAVTATDNIEVKSKNLYNQQKCVGNKKEGQSGVNKFYSTFNEAFSLKNKDNTLPSIVSQSKKLIKNNKKKKDKFAGLCEMAIRSATKIKDDQDKKNKLNLFLKPQ